MRIPKNGSEKLLMSVEKGGGSDSEWWGQLEEQGWSHCTTSGEADQCCEDGEKEQQRYLRRQNPLD